MNYLIRLMITMLSLFLVAPMSVAHDGGLARCTVEENQVSLVFRDIFDRSAMTLSDQKDLEGWAVGKFRLSMDSNDVIPLKFVGWVHDTKFQVEAVYNHGTVFLYDIVLNNFEPGAKKFSFEISNSSDEKENFDIMSVLPPLKDGRMDSERKVLSVTASCEKHHVN